jgi:hypothetical protein
LFGWKKQLQPLKTLFDITKLPASSRDMPFSFEEAMDLAQDLRVIYGDMNPVVPERPNFLIGSRHCNCIMTRLVERFCKQVQGGIARKILWLWCNLFCFQPCSKTLVA